MVDTKPDAAPRNPGFQVNHSEGLQTKEFKKIAAVQSLSEGLINLWGAQDAWTGDFKRVLNEAISALLKADSAENATKLDKLVSKLKGPAQAAEVPAEERTAEEQQMVEEEMAAADLDGDGVVSMNEGMQRVYNLFKEVGLDDMASYFVTNRKKRSEQ